MARILPFILILLVILYLNRTYALLFDYPGEKGLQSPFTETSLILPGDSSTGSAKYAVLGASLSAGVGSADYHTTYPYFLAEKLAKNYHQLNLVILAVPGATTADVINNQLPRAITENPDYITLLTGINDLRKHGTLDDFTTKYYQLVRSLKAHTHAKILLLNLPYLGSSAITYPPYNWIIDWRMHEYNDIIKATAQAMQLPMADIYSGTRTAAGSDTSYYSVDQFHPSAKGYILWSSLLNAY